MAGFNVPTTRNYIKRCFEGIVEPRIEGKEFERLCTYFGCKCAYCNKHLPAHVKGCRTRDHLKGKSNALSNIVLACKSCNSEKSDSSWEDFLDSKSSTRTIYQERARLIKAWVKQEKRPLKHGMKPLRKTAGRLCEKVLLCFDENVRKLKKAIESQ